MVAQHEGMQLEPEFALALRELKNDHNFKYLWAQLKDRRESLIRATGEPGVIVNHALLAAYCGQIEEINHLFDDLRMAGGDNDELDKL